MNLYEIWRDLYKRSDTFFYQGRSNWNMLEKRVAAITNYLEQHSMELKGVPNDEDALLHAILAGLPEDKKNGLGGDDTSRIQQLRRLLASASGENSGTGITAEVGKLLEKQLGVSIQEISYHVIDNVVTQNPSFSENTQLNQDSCLKIIDLNGHFVTALPKALTQAPIENNSWEDEIFFEKVLGHQYTAAPTLSGSDSIFHAVLGEKDADGVYVDREVDAHKEDWEEVKCKDFVIDSDALEDFGIWSSLTIYLHEGLDITPYNPGESIEVHILVITDESDNIFYERMEPESLSPQQIDNILFLLRREQRLFEDEEECQHWHVIKISKVKKFQEIAASINLQYNIIHSQDNHVFIEIDFNQQKNINDFIQVGLEAIRRKYLKLAENIFENMSVRSLKNYILEFLKDKIKELKNNSSALETSKHFNMSEYALAIIFLSPENFSSYIIAYDVANKNNQEIIYELIKKAYMCPSTSFKHKTVITHLYVKPLWSALEQNRSIPWVKSDEKVLWKFLLNPHLDAKAQDKACFKRMAIQFSAYYFHIFFNNNNIRNIEDITAMLAWIEKTPRNTWETDEKALHRELIENLFILLLNNRYHLNCSYEDLIFKYFVYCLEKNKPQRFIDSLGDSPDVENFPYLKVYLSLASNLENLSTTLQEINLFRSTAALIESNMNMSLEILLYIAIRLFFNYTIVSEKEKRKEDLHTAFLLFEQVYELENKLPDEILLYYWAVSVFLNENEEPSKQILSILEDSDKRLQGENLQQEYYSVKPSAWNVKEEAKRKILVFIGFVENLEFKTQFRQIVSSISLSHEPKISNPPGKGTFDREHLTQNLWKAIVDMYLPIVLCKASGKAKSIVDESEEISLGELRREGITEEAINEIKESKIKVPKKLEGNLRIDFQEPSFFALSKTTPILYNHIAVQWGTGNKRKEGGAYAGIFVQINIAFPLYLYQKALNISKEGASNVILYQDINKKNKLIQVIAPNKYKEIECERLSSYQGAFINQNNLNGKKQSSSPTPYPKTSYKG